MDALNALIELPWRHYLAAALMLLGAALAARGLRAMIGPLRDSVALLRWVRGFRTVVIGLALAGIGAAWLWQQAWILAVALGVSGVETLESSTSIAVLRGERREAAVAARPRAGARPIG